MKIILILLFTAFLLPAQTERDTVYVLPAVIVESTRSERDVLSVPMSVDVIGAERIQSSGTGRLLDDVMISVPGLFIGDRNNPSLGEKVTIRGIGSRAAFGIRGIKILIDDIPVTMPDGQSQINNIDFNSAGQIEILRGPGSSLYGNSAGGVIHLTTELPQKGLSLSPKFVNGAFGLQKYNLKVTSGGNTSYLLSINKTNYKGFREHSQMTSSGVNAMIISSLSSSLRVKAVFNIFDSPYLLNPSSLNAADASVNPSAVRSFIKQQGAGEKTRQFQTGATMNLVLNNSRFESTVYYISRSLFNPIPGRIIDLTRDAGGLRTLYSYHTDWNKLQLVFSLGTDVELQYDKRTETVNNGIPDEAAITKPEDYINTVSKGEILLNQDEQVTGIGPFASVEINLGKFILSTGLRYDRFTFKAADKHTAGAVNSGSRVMDQVSPMAGILYKTGDFSKLFINYATSFQTPSLNELGNRPDAEGGFNPLLEPEKLYSIETGYKNFLTAIHTEVSAALFFINFTDLLIPYQSAGAGDEVFYRNAGKARNTGIEIGINVFPAAGLIFTSAFTYMNFRFLDYIINNESDLHQLKDNEIPGIPSLRFTTGISYIHTTGLFGEVNFRYTGSYFTNDYNGAPPGSESPQENFVNDSYTRTDIRGGIRTEFLRFTGSLFFGINNLFDKRYNGSIVPNAAAERYFEPAPGRHWYAGISAEF